MLFIVAVVAGGMPRLTISLTAEQHDWVAREAEREDCSQSAVLRAAVDEQRLADGADDKSDLVARIDALEDRIRELECGERGGEVGGERHGGHESRGEAAGEDSGEQRGEQTGEEGDALRERVADGDWAASQYRQTPARVDAVTAVVRELRDRGRLISPEVEEIVGRHCDVGVASKLVRETAGEWPEVDPPVSGSNRWAWDGE